MAIYDILNDYSLSKADKEGVKEIRKNNVFIASKGNINFQPCIYWKAKYGELVAVEVDDENLDGYVIGMT